MKKISFIFALLICLSSCRYKDRTVQIFPHANELEFSYRYDQRIDLTVVDNRRDRKFVGIKYPLVSNMNEDRKDISYFTGRKGYDNKISILSSDVDLSGVLRQKILRNLNQKGFMVDESSSNKLRIELLELNVVSNAYKNRATSKIKVIATNRIAQVEKIYDLKAESKEPLLDMFLFGPFGPGSDGGYYDDMIINKSIDSNLEQILRDENIWTSFRNHISN